MDTPENMEGERERERDKQREGMWKEGFDIL